MFSTSNYLKLENNMVKCILFCISLQNIVETHQHRWSHSSWKQRQKGKFEVAEGEMKIILIKWRYFCKREFYKFKPCTYKIYLLFWVLIIFYSVYKNDWLNTKSNDLSSLTVRLAAIFLNKIRLQPGPLTECVYWYPSTFAVCIDGHFSMRKGIVFGRSENYT